MPHSRFAATKTVFDWLLRLFALMVLALMLARALQCASGSYDVWYYHMPFATRLAGIVPPSVFHFYPEDAERFKGFPLLGEAIQGALWRISGHAEAANLLAFSSIPLFALFLARRFAVPWHVSVLSLLAIPIAHTHSVDSHVDLPAGAATAALLLITIQAFAAVEPPSIGSLVLAALAAIFAMNTKLVVGPVVLLGVGLLGLRIFLLSRRLAEPLRRRYRLVLAGWILILPVVFATPLKNAVLYGNPIYPLQLTILGHKLHGPEIEYVANPVWLENAPRPVRFAASVLEVKNLPFSDPERWNVGQWAPLTHPAYRMGGFFNAYVILQLGALGLRLFRERSREVRVAAGAFGLVTLITSILPQSHEARYYMYWMLLLVAINLWLACRAGVTALRSRGLGAMLGARGLGAMAALALCAVLLVTRGAYASPKGTSFSELIRAHVDSKLVAEIHDGETVCVMHEPWNLLWSAPFHPPLQYVIPSAQVDTSECRGFRLIDARKPRRRKKAGAASPP